MTRTEHPLLSPSLGSCKQLVSFGFGDPQARPKVYIQASLHAEELPGMLVAHHLRDALTRLDARGVATLVRLHPPGEPLGADELRIELTPKNGQWTLVTDAWFFREGDAARWQAARFGEFRVAADGRALLVGLADEKLAAIKP